MQTFMPYQSYTQVAKTLDYKRLGKQRVEGMQTYNQLTKGKGGYPHHPINKMWTGYESSLAEYTNAMITQWITRGYNNTMETIRCCWQYRTGLHYETKDGGEYYDLDIHTHQKPNWVFDNALHTSHQSNLLRKDYEYYRHHFSTDIPIDLPYIWYKD